MTREARFLYVLVFVVGMASLGAEIAAARLMAPYFGASTIVWANTIAVVLVSLSAGYWLGGRLGDDHPHLRGLCLLVWAPPRSCWPVVPFAARPFFDISVDALDSISAGAFVGSLIGVLALVALPVVLLGACSPWAVRLRRPMMDHLGRTRRPALRDLDRRLAGRDDVRRASASSRSSGPSAPFSSSRSRWGWWPQQGSAGAIWRYPPQWPESSRSQSGP